MVNYAAVRDLLVHAQFELEGGDVQSERLSKAIDYLIEVVEDECPKRGQAQVIPFPAGRRVART